MAAVIHIRSTHGPDDVAGSGARVGRPTLSVLDGGRSAAARRMRRIYLARRLMAATVLALLVAAAVPLVGAAVGDGADGISLGSPTAGTSGGVHVVQPGDTLWSIATSLEPAADPRETVRRLIELNESQPELASTGQLRIGQELVLPASGR